LRKKGRKTEAMPCEVQISIEVGGKGKKNNAPGRKGGKGGTVRVTHQKKRKGLASWFEKGRGIENNPIRWKEKGGGECSTRREKGGKKKRGPMGGGKKETPYQGQLAEEGLFPLDARGKRMGGRTFL